jgi:hypothetical protein
MGNEEFYNIHSSPDIIMMIKSTRMRWAGSVAHMGEMTCAQNLSENLNGK